MQINRFAKIILVTFLIILLTTIGFAMPYAPDDFFVESEQVSHLLPDPEESFNTPGFSPGKENFTTHEEMMSFIYDLQQKSNNMQVKIIGFSQEGRPIPLLIFSNPSYDKPADILRLNKPVVWLQGQQHGNEPAGGEAMLAMAERLAVGDLGKEVLDKISVLIIPRCNPDGSYYFERRTATTIDTNRDNVKFDLPETQALHKAFNDFHPDIVIDAHEYSVSRDYLDIGPKGHISYYDMLMLSSTNLNVPAKITETADDLLIGNAEKALDDSHFTHHWYYGASKSTNGFAKKISMAGYEPIIARNAYGLQPAVSILVESRGIGIGRQHLARRVMGHVIIHTSFLRTTAQHAETIKRTIEEARQEITDKGTTVSSDNKIIISAKPVKLKSHQFDLINLENATIGTFDVEGYTFKNAVPALERVRPYAYIMPPAYHDIAKQLAFSGVTVRKSNVPLELLVETYKVTNQKVQQSYFEGHLRNYVNTELAPKTITFPAGSYIYYMAQPTANLIAMILEPESTSSFVTFNYLPVNVGDEIPVYRLMNPQKLDTYIVDIK